ncbi:MAG: ArsR family transcriptional regulator [Nanoarchaeota archaeon]|nr:ArsR family transcriptional regulator [Nanoarchaeota archaeon]
MDLKSRKSNPFSIQPNPNLVGMDQERDKLLKYVSNNSICFLNGPPGVGKSSLLSWVKENLKGYKPIYLDAKDVDEYFDLKRHLKDNTFFLRRWLGKYAKNIVILLDEAQASDKKLIDSLEVLWNQAMIKSIVITQIKPHLTNYPESFKNRLGDRVIRLGRLNTIRAHEMITQRTDGRHPFTDEAIALISEKADYVPRKILELCEIILIESEGKKKITEADVSNVFDKVKAEKLEQEILDLEEEDVDENVLVPLEKVDELDKVSPMEKRIIKLLLESGKTSIQLSTILNTSAGSIGKQLSKLTQAGIIEIVNSRRPKIYGVSQGFKEELKKGLEEHK